MYRRVCRIWMMSFFKEGKKNIPLNKTPLTNQKYNKQKCIRNDKYKKYDHDKQAKKSDKISLQLQQPLQMEHQIDDAQHQHPYQENITIPQQQNHKKFTKLQQDKEMNEKAKKHKQDLLKLADYAQNFGIKKMVTKLLSKSSAEIKKASEELFSFLEFQFKANYNAFQCALVIIGLHNSNNNFFTYRQRSFIFFFSIYNMEVFMFYPRQGQNAIEIHRPIHRDIKKQYKDLVFNEILKHFPSFYINIRSKHEKFKYKCGMFNFLTQLQGHKLTFETINKILDVLAMILFQQDNQVDKFKATRIFNNVISNFIENVEKNPDLVKNLSLRNLNLRQFHMMTMRSYYQMISSEIKSNDSQNMIHLIVKLAKVLRLVNCDRLEDIKKFLNIIKSDNLYVNESNFTLLKFYHLMLKTFITQIDQNGNNPIIEKIKINNLINLEKKQNFKASFMRDYGLFYQIMRFKFYRNYIMQKSQIIQGHIVIKQKPTIPPLDDFEIRYYKEHQPQIIKHEFGSMAGIMTNLYPEIVTKKEFTKQNEMNEKKKLLKDNQIAGRLAQAISKLNIQYQKQAMVRGNRTVDFLLKNNIIVQCDGDIHIDFSTMNVNCSTAFRNLSQILFGYRIVIICMNEVNEKRDPQSLQDLLKKKLRILQENNAYLVQ